MIRIKICILAYFLICINFINAADVTVNFNFIDAKSLLPAQNVRVIIWHTACEFCYTTDWLDEHLYGNSEGSAYIDTSFSDFNGQVEFTFDSDTLKVDTPFNEGIISVTIENNQYFTPLSADIIYINQIVDDTNVIYQDFLLHPISAPFSVTAILKDYATGQVITDSADVLFQTSCWIYEPREIYRGWCNVESFHGTFPGFINYDSLPPFREYQVKGYVNGYYESLPTPFSGSMDSALDLTIEMVPLELGTSVSGRVTTLSNGDTIGLSGISVDLYQMHPRLFRQGIDEIESDENGFFNFPNKIYLGYPVFISVTVNGRMKSHQIEMSPDSSVVINFHLEDITQINKFKNHSDSPSITITQNNYRQSYSIKLHSRRHLQGRLTILDIQGFEIFTHENWSSDRILNWNGKGVNGQLIGSGVYYILFVTQGKIITQRITLLL